MLYARLGGGGQLELDRPPPRPCSLAAAPSAYLNVRAPVAHAVAHVARATLHRVELWKILTVLPALIEALARLVRAIGEARRRWSKRPPPPPEAGD